MATWIPHALQCVHSHPAQSFILSKWVASCQVCNFNPKTTWDGKIQPNIQHVSIATRDFAAANWWCVDCKSCWTKMTCFEMCFLCETQWNTTVLATNIWWTYKWNNMMIIHQTHTHITTHSRTFGMVPFTITTITMISYSALVFQRGFTEEKSSVLLPRGRASAHPSGLPRQSHCPSQPESPTLPWCHAPRWRLAWRKSAEKVFCCGEKTYWGM